MTKSKLLMARCDKTMRVEKNTGLSVGKTMRQ